MGERNFGLDSLKSMNRDMEEKGIVLRELSCRTAAELSPPDLPDCRKTRRSFSGSLASGVHRRSCRTAAEALAAVRSGELGGSPAAQLREYNPFLLHVSSSGLPLKLRRQSAALAGGARRQSGRERDCTPGAELPPSSPRRSCSSAGPQNLSYALIGGEWGSGR